MFRAEILQLENNPSMKMEGRLVGEWAKEAQSLVTKESIPNGLIIDLTEVTHIDRVGEQVLNWFGSIGAAFVAKNVYIASVCQRLGLPMHEPTSNGSNHRRTGGERGSSSGNNGSRPRSSDRSEE